MPNSTYSFPPNFISLFLEQEMTELIIYGENGLGSISCTCVHG